jgi:hypothetical protein
MIEPEREITVRFVRAGEVLDLYHCRDGCHAAVVARGILAKLPDPEPGDLLTAEWREPNLIKSPLGMSPVETTNPAWLVRHMPGFYCFLGGDGRRPPPGGVWLLHSERSRNRQRSHTIPVDHYVHAAR